MAKLTRVTPEYVMWKRSSDDSISRLLADYLEAPVLALDFGAKGDGVTDDTSAFIAALAYLPTGAVIDLGGLTYVATITLDRKFKIRNGKVIASVAGRAAVHVKADGCVVEDIETFVDVNDRGKYTQQNVSGIFVDTVESAYVRGCLAVGSKCDVYNNTDSWGDCIGAFKSKHVVFESCVVRSSHREALMTRFCDQVFMFNCQGYDSGDGHSNIGTSGGSVAIISGCYSKNSGATGITMNNNTSIVSDCIVEGNRKFNGILIGHNHEVEAYAGSCMIANCIVRGSDGNGIIVDKPLRAIISDNVVESVGTGGAASGNGILVNNPQDNAQVNISNNDILTASAAGIYAAMQTGNGYELILSNNNVRGATLHGIRVENTKYTKLSGNKVRGSGQCGIRVWSNTNTARAEHLMLDGNTVEFCGENSFDIFGVKYLTLKGNTHLGFNQNNTAALSAVVIRGNDGTVNLDLPDVIHVSGDTFLPGNVGSGMHSITITADNLATTGKRLTVTGCSFYDTTREAVTPSARYSKFYSANSRGPDAGLVSVVVPANGTLVVDNTNQTTLSMPHMVGKDSGSLQVVIQSLGNGTLTLRNYNATTAASVTLAW